MLRLIRLLAAMLIVPVLCVTKLCAGSQPAAPYVTPQMMKLIAAHRHVLERMNAPDKDSKPPQLDDPGMEPLLTEGWKLAGEWAAAWLDLHPDASTKQLDKLFVDFTPPPPHPKYYDENQPVLYAMEGSATRIAQDVYVVTTTYATDEIESTSGTFLVVSRNASGHLQPMWDIKPLAEQHYALKDEIGLWAVLESCMYHCGPMVVDKILPLPPTRKGLLRFAVDAFQATNGGTMEAQFSVWDWNGREANAEVIQSYNHVADDGAIQVQGNLIRIATKEPTNTIAPCGMCPEPHGEWTLRLTPDGTKDLGHRFRTPEMQWADQLLTTIAASGDASTMASPDVIAKVRGAILKRRAKYPPSQGETEQEGGFVFFGMFDRCNILSRGQQGAFVLKLDDIEFKFSYEMHGNQPFFTGLVIKDRS